MLLPVLGSSAARAALQLRLQQVAGSSGFLEAGLGPGAGSIVPGRPDGCMGSTPVAFPLPEPGILILTCARPTLPSL